MCALIGKVVVVEAAACVATGVVEELVIIKVNLSAVVGLIKIQAATVTGRGFVALKEIATH